MKTARAIMLMLITGAVATTAAERLDLAQCIELGVRNNLRLRNAELEMASAVETAAGVRGIYDSQFSAGISHVDSGISEAGSFISGDQERNEASAGLRKMLSSGTELGLSVGATSYDADFPDIGEAGRGFDIKPYSTKVELSLNQSLLRNSFGKTDRSMVKIADYGVSIAEGVFEREDERLRKAVVDAYWNHYAATASHDVGSESLSLAKRLHESNRKKFKDNLLDETDMLATEAVVETRTAELTRLKNVRMNAHDGLARMIRVPARNWSGVEFLYPENTKNLPDEVKTLGDSGALFDKAVKNRKDLQALRLRLEQAELDVEAKGDSLDPDLSLFGSIARGASEEDFGDTTDLGDTSWAVGIRFQTPLSRSKEKSDMRKAELVKNAASNDVIEREEGILQECRGAARELINARARLLATDKASNLFARKLKLETQKFDQGRSDIRWVIETQEDLAQSRVSYHISYAQYQKARAACYAVQGVKLEGRSK